ncbi:hypothetical protein [Massilia sp. 9096]|uniref:hypothetical protein n=1 Tax=Massilia sp. 9096 TaxID=1500894 RepID=UPI000568F9D3|nr:hypothetical protein [Massilia sp. 9096]
MKRASHTRAQTPAIGTGELHQALEDERNRIQLAEFCSAHVCTPDQVSNDGKRLYLPRVLQLMRDRGYQVSEPAPAPHQPKRGFTAWLVHVRIKSAEFDLGFYTPDAGKAGPVRKPQPSNLEHA